MRIVTTKTYERAVRKLLSADARVAMESRIVAEPQVAPVIPGTGGIRKLRWAGAGRGKRGGIRAIYFFLGETMTVYMLTAYAKADREDLRPADLRAWARLVEQIKAEEGQR